jgi:hypothetical protein
MDKTAYVNKNRTEVVTEHAHTYSNTCSTLTRSVVKREIVGSGRFKGCWLVQKKTEEGGHRPHCHARSGPLQLSLHTYGAPILTLNFTFGTLNEQERRTKDDRNSQTENTEHELDDAMLVTVRSLKCIT